MTVNQDVVSDRIKNSLLGLQSHLNELNSAINKKDYEIFGNELKCPDKESINNKNEEKCLMEYLKLIDNFHNIIDKAYNFILSI